MGGWSTGIVVIGFHNKYHKQYALRRRLAPNMRDALITAQKGVQPNDDDNKSERNQERKGKESGRE